MTKTSSNKRQAKAEEIIDFWLNDVGAANWYSQSDEIDELIAERYKSLREEAARGALEDWMESPEGALALMLLLDQFSRNLYRGEAESFAADEYARKLAKEAIDAGFDREFEPNLRQFFYLPFCHSENLSDQEWLVAQAESAGLSGNLVDFHAHKEIIEIFGRFPFRNAALGRETTPEEQEFLNEGGYVPIRKKWMERLGA